MEIITETCKFIQPEQSRSRKIPISLLLGLISLPVIFGILQLILLVKKLI